MALTAFTDLSSWSQEPIGSTSLIGCYAVAKRTVNPMLAKINEVPRAVSMPTLLCKPFVVSVASLKWSTSEIAAAATTAPALLLLLLLPCANGSVLSTGRSEIVGSSNDNDDGDDKGWISMILNGVTLPLPPSYNWSLSAAPRKALSPAPRASPPTAGTLALLGHGSSGRRMRETYAHTP